MRRTKLLAGAAALALGIMTVQSGAKAAVMQVLQPRQLSSTPIVVPLGTATFSFTLDAAGVGNGPQSFIQSNAAGGVASIFGSVADFESGSAIDGNYPFAAYSTPTSIQYSSAVDFVGLSYTTAGQTHYAFAEVFGATFVGYAYETSPNTTIVTQAVPEPASAALLMGGLAMVGVARRKKRNGQLGLAA